MVDLLIFVTIVIVMYINVQLLNVHENFVHSVAL